MSFHIEGSTSVKRHPIVPMADGGLSIVGLVLATQGVVQALVNYASSVKGGKSEIQALATELSALVGLLECIENQRKSSSTEPNSPSLSKYSSQTFLQGLQSIRNILSSLHMSLEPAESKLGQAAKVMMWHWKRDEVQKQIARIERVKEFIIMVTTSDNR